jgi:hypothetical protein
MALEHFAVVHERGGSPLFSNPLVHAFDGCQLVLAFVDRAALRDHFRIPGDVRLTIRDWNLVVERNLAAFKRVISAKYDRGQRSIYYGHGQEFPRVDVTLEDLERSGEEFSADVLKINAHFA